MARQKFNVSYRADVIKQERKKKKAIEKYLIQGTKSVEFQNNMTGLFLQMADLESMYLHYICCKNTLIILQDVFPLKCLTKLSKIYCK